MAVAHTKLMLNTTQVKKSITSTHLPFAVYILMIEHVVTMLTLYCMNYQILPQKIIFPENIINSAPR